MDFHKHALILGMIETLRSQGSRTGKTHVIKGLMLGSAAKALDVPFGFFLYKHGPYSTDVEEALEQMESYGAITKTPAFDGYGVIMQPGQNASFVYKQAPLSDEEKAGIRRVCTFIRSKNVGELERLATAAWIRTRMEVSDSDEVVKQLRSLKPHVTSPEARQADTEIAELLQGD